MNAKQAAGKAAARDFIHSGQIIGLGTGSTTQWAMEELSQLMRNGKVSNILVATTSIASEIECSRLNIPLVPLHDPRLAKGFDLVIDGADWVSREGVLVKGGGGAHLREKIVAYHSRELVIVITKEKLINSLAFHPIPVEVIPDAREWVRRELETMQAKVSLRTGSNKAGPVVTDAGNLILDAVFPALPNARETELALNAIPGVVENGIFSCCSFTLLVGKENGSVEKKAVTPQGAVSRF